jgi:hypothetical protein
MKKLLLMSLLMMFSFYQAVMAAEAAIVSEETNAVRLERPAVLTDERLTTENAGETVDCFYEENRANEACTNDRQETRRARAY